MKPAFFVPVVQHHVETARHGDNELVQGFVAMTAPFRAAGHIVQIVDPLDVERNMPLPSMKVRLPRGSVILGRSIILQFPIAIRCIPANCTIPARITNYRRYQGEHALESF